MSICLAESPPFMHEDKISIDLDVPLRVVQWVKQTWNHIGRVCRSREFMGRHPLLSPEQTQFMLALIEHSPDIYLDEIQELLQELHGIKISVSSIWRTLKRLGMSAKKGRNSIRAAPSSSGIKASFIILIINGHPEPLSTASLPSEFFQTPPFYRLSQRWSVLHTE
ncbi:hypothetical protein EDB85DRAFT_2143001 [Lactarius pseudohatsudake]|nr:hypothetical protein EDB85DRAFT_2143001 [Lactarius pseudohatsudake]